MSINCSSAWQWEHAKNGSVEFDADIVGPGVIASFIAAALTALISLVVAYATFSIPTELINDIDGVIARGLRATFTFLRTLVHIPSIAKTEGEEARDERIKVFQTFMLSISDQVLVSEMAILIATFAKYEDITIYSVNVIVALGCLASTVHLAMMPLLVRQMRKHRVIKASRSISMVIAAILLVVLLIFQINDTWGDGTHIYFRCALHDWKKDSYYLAANWIGFAVQLLVPIFIIYANYEIIRLLYSRRPDGEPESAREDPATANPTRRRNRVSRMYNQFSEMRTYSQQSQMRRFWARHKARTVIQKNLSLKEQRQEAFFIAQTWVFHECQESFFWRILWLLSGNLYGLFDVLSARSNSDGISGDRDSMGYGQIVPLVLLILPIFAVIQNYRDRIKDSREQTDSTEEHPTPSEDTPHTITTHSQMGLVRVHTADYTGTLSRSATIATAPGPSSSVRRRQTGLSNGNSPRLNDEIMMTVFSSPTLPPPEDEVYTRTGVDRSLRQWALHDKYEEMPFVSVSALIHSVFMLLFVSIYGWGMTTGYYHLVLTLNMILIIIMALRVSGSVYFWMFGRKHKDLFREDHLASREGQATADHSQRMMYAHGAEAAAEEDEE
ncbi:hypothetical protein BDW74DRAFT_174774 [Aspergillus multicolor]|uniref:G-protein coupled receptor n=1 Tax=Aspergillus multicolor TaxID=41759 RepID=UPI003CCCAE6A